jgi:hypothetical protein
MKKGNKIHIRNTQLTNTLNHLLSQSTIYMGGSENKSSTSSDGRTRILESAQGSHPIGLPEVKTSGKPHF